MALAMNAINVCRHGLAAAALLVCASAFGGTSLLPPPGVSDDEIHFAQSACFSGPNQELGCQYHAGVLAAFDEANGSDGVKGRMLRISTFDDGYESDQAAENAKRIAAEDNVLAAIGSVGTPTAKRMVATLRDASIPMIGLYTGADFLYDQERYPNVVNLRASYAQEAELLVEHMHKALKKRRFGIIYQDDAFGRLVLKSYKAALERRGLSILARSSYTRNTHAFHSALFVLAPAELDALMIVGSYSVNGEIIRLIHSLERDYVVANVSFVNSGELSERVEFMRDKVFVTEVMPDPEDSSIGLVADFRRAMAALDTALPEPCPAIEEASIASLEGYALGRFLISVLERLPDDAEISRDALLKNALTGAPVDLGDWHIAFEAGSNAGSRYVRLLRLSELEHKPEARLDATR